jgi:hypothetical protein
VAASHPGSAAPGASGSAHPATGPDRHSIRKDIGVPVLAALVGFGGALMGSVVGAWITTSSNEALHLQEVELQQMKDRYALLERVSRLMGKAPAFAVMWQRANSDKTSAAEQLAMAEKLAEFRGDCDAAMRLARETFGPLTRDAIGRINSEKPWWEKSQEQQFEVLDAMAKEVRYGLRLPQLGPAAAQRADSAASPPRPAAD